MCLIKLFTERIFYEPLNNRAVNNKMDEQQRSWLWYKVCAFVYKHTIQPPILVVEIERQGVCVFAFAQAILIQARPKTFRNILQYEHLMSSFWFAAFECAHCQCVAHS